MLEEKIIELKTKISNLYNMYLECDNKKEYIIKLAKIFNIPIFEVLASNYRIVSIDVNNLSIIIEDTKYNITYKSAYTSNADLFNYNGNVIRFIEVVENGNDKSIKKLYHIGDEIPIISQMIYESKGRVLELIKEESNDENTFLDNGKKLVIRYLEDENEKYVPKLTSIYKKGDTSSYERFYTYDGVDCNTFGNLIDKSSCIINNDLVYIVYDLSLQKQLVYIKGICFENLDLDINRFRVNGINLNEFKELKSKENISAMIFKGIVDNEMCILEIYKRLDCISVIYRKCNNAIDEQEDKSVLLENIELPILSNGKINDREIYTVINLLSEDSFINIVINELNEFIKRIYVKNKMAEDEFFFFTPKILIDKPFELISNIIEKDIGNSIDSMESKFNLVADSYRKIR